MFTIKHQLKRFCKVDWETDNLQSKGVPSLNEHSRKDEAADAGEGALTKYTVLR